MGGSSPDVRRVSAGHRVFSRHDLRPGLLVVAGWDQDA